MKFCQPLSLSYQVLGQLSIYLLPCPFTVPARWDGNVDITSIQGKTRRTTIFPARKENMSVGARELTPTTCVVEGLLHGGALTALGLFEHVIAKARSQRFAVFWSCFVRKLKRDTLVSQDATCSEHHTHPRQARVSVHEHAGK